MDLDKVINILKYETALTFPTKITYAEFSAAIETAIKLIEKEQHSRQKVKDMEE